MTLLVALKASDGIVMAADSRGTFGDPRGVTAQNDTMIKAYPLGATAGCLLAGSGEIGSLLIQEFQRQLGASQAADVEQLVASLIDFARGKYQHWFPSIPPVAPPMMLQAGQMVGRPDVTILIAGYDSQGESAIYQLSSGLDWAPMLHNYGFAVAGVPQYALYLLNRLYDSNKTRKELEALAVYVITETASQDGKVGGPVQLLRINRAEAAAVAADEVHRIIADNEARQDTLRNSFYEEVS